MIIYIRKLFVVMAMCFALTLCPVASAEIDLSTYTNEELFALQTAISDELNKRREVDFYENGELAYIQTEWGNLFFGITKAEILPETSDHNSVYQITWECRNESFITDQGAVFSIDAYSFVVSDSNNQTVSPTASSYCDEPTSASAAPGKKCYAAHTFYINDPSCEYLDVFLGVGEVSFRIQVDNPVSGTEDNKAYSEEEIRSVVAEILQLKNNETDRALDLIKTYSSYMTKEQLRETMLSYAKWNALSVAEDEVKKTLKSPRSYKRYGGNIWEPVEQQDGTYQVAIKVDFGSTNSFGAEIRDEDNLTVTFTLDMENISVNYISAELSAYDRWQVANGG